MNRQPSERHIIWSNLSLDVDDWREAYKEFLEANELDADPNDENGLYEYMVETNDEYLTDERLNLNVRLSQPIIVIGDLGLWNGRRSGYKMIDSGNIKDCLFSDTDYTEWYVDKYGDLRADAVHHDGTNHLSLPCVQGRRFGHAERKSAIQNLLWQGDPCRHHKGHKKAWG